MSVTLFGEVMLRLTPSQRFQTIGSASTLDSNYAGAEANVASSLATLGHATQFVSKFPANPVGDAAVSSLHRYEICTQYIKRGGHRLGTYFIELGASIRPSRVVYDRKYSAISEIGEDEFDWEMILKGQQWLHLSGITPALSTQCAKETLKAAQTAQSMGVKVSFDLNYRRTLWNDVSQARTVFSDILDNTDLALGNAGVVADVFDVHYKNQATERAASYLKETFSLPMVAFTNRVHTSSTKNTLSGLFLKKDKVVSSNAYEVDIIDRFGTGDAFAAGLLHALLHSKSDQDSINFASAAFALKHTLLGDQHVSNAKQIQAVANGETSGHVLR